MISTQYNQLIMEASIWFHFILEAESRAYGIYWRRGSFKRLDKGGIGNAGRKKGKLQIWNCRNLNSCNRLYMQVDYRFKRMIYSINKQRSSDRHAHFV